jgi:hypothetical protein
LLPTASMAGIAGSQATSLRCSMASGTYEGIAGEPGWIRASAKCTSCFCPCHSPQRLAGFHAERDPHTSLLGAGSRIGSLPSRDCTTADGCRSSANATSFVSVPIFYRILEH